MGFNLRFLLFVFSVVWIIIILFLLKKDRIPIKYSLFWLLSILVILLVSIVPQFFLKIINLVGFETISNMIIGMILTLLLMITLLLTIIISNQKKTINMLIQELSILKGKEKFDNKKSK